MLYYYIVCVILLHCLCYIITLSLWFLKLPPSYSSSLITEPCVVYSYYSAEVNKCDLDKVIPPATDRNDNILPPTPVLQYVSIPHTNYLLTVWSCVSLTLCLFISVSLYVRYSVCVYLCVFFCVCLSVCVCGWGYTHCTPHCYTFLISPGCLCFLCIHDFTSPACTNCLTYGLLCVFFITYM